MARIFLERRDMDDDLRGLFDALEEGAEGRFARGVLRVTRPRIDERRGRALRIPVQAD